MSDYFIIMENEPSIEDLRAEILEYQSKIEQLNTNIENLNNQINEKDKTITTLNSDIGNLKQKNYDLFMQVSNTPQTPPEPKPVEVVSLDTIINTIRGED